VKADYKDIKSRISEEPKWYDENGTPRYCEFHPDESPNIYADEVVLLDIACQACERRFDVEINWHALSVISGGRPESPSEVLRKWLRNARSGMCPLHYGDPPIHGCATGNTMNCIDIAVKQFWKKESMKEWERVPELEVPLESLDDYQ